MSKIGEKIQSFHVNYLKKIYILSSRSFKNSNGYIVCCKVLSLYNHQAPFVLYWAPQRWQTWKSGLADLAISSVTISLFSSAPLHPWYGTPLLHDLYASLNCILSNKLQLRSISAVISAASFKSFSSERRKNRETQLEKIFLFTAQNFFVWSNFFIKIIYSQESIKEWIKISFQGQKV